MKRKVLAVVTAFSLVAMIPLSAEAKSYDNCTQLTRKYDHGVAKTRKAAKRAVRDGHGMPKVSRRLYNQNDHLDADNDKVACER